GKDRRAGQAGRRGSPSRISSALVPAPTDLPRKVELFESLSDRGLKKLADSFKESTFSAGGVIATEGQRGVGFFVISEGTVDYTIHDDKVGMGGPGDYFGEVALIDDGPRTATVTATTDVTAYGLTSWEFRPLVEENASIAWELLQTMAKRLRAATSYPASQLLHHLYESLARPGRVAAERDQLRLWTNRSRDCPPDTSTEDDASDGRGRAPARDCCGRLPLPGGRVDRALPGDDEVVGLRVETEQVEDRLRAGHELRAERRQRGAEPAGRPGFGQIGEQSQPLDRAKALFQLGDLSGRRPLLRAEEARRVVQRRRQVAQDATRTRQPVEHLEH